MVYQFTPNPSIRRQQTLGNTLLAQALQRRPMPTNPYAASPFANAASRLAQGLAARDAFSQADELQKQGQIARANIMSKANPTTPGVDPVYPTAEESMQAGYGPEIVPQMRAQRLVTEDAATNRAYIQSQRADEQKQRQLQNIVIDKLNKNQPVTQSELQAAFPGEYAKQAFKRVKPKGTSFTQTANAPSGVGTLYDKDNNTLTATNVIDGKIVLGPKISIQTGQPIATTDSTSAFKPFDPAEQKLKQKEAEEKQKLIKEWPRVEFAYDTANNELNNGISRIDQAIDLIKSNPKTVGRAHKVFLTIGDPDTVLVKNLIEGIKGEAMFEKLTQLREGSSSGASGLGALNKSEAEALQLTKFTATQMNSPKDLIRALEDRKRALKNANKTSTKLYNSQKEYLFGETDSTTGATDRETSANTLIKKYLGQED